MNAADPPALLPGVSVILPILNEDRHLEEALTRILAQEYGGPLEVVLAVGPSSDATHQIAERIAASDPRVVVVENPTGKTASGLNVAVAAGRYDLLIRVDGHANLPDGYVALVEQVLRETGAANVGGMMVPIGRTPFEQAVARAMSSPLGIGSARIHTGGKPGPADTVYLGAFRRAALEGVGGFDERFVRAQDWELNLRLRRAGEVVWFDPRLAVTYRPRGTWSDLVRQFFRTGQWRRQVIRAYPGTAGLRYLAPPLTVIAVVGGALLAVFGAGVGPRSLVASVIVPVAYVCIVLGGSVVVGRGLSWPARLRLPVVIGTMHLAWGAGFLRGLGRHGVPALVRRDYPGPARTHHTGATTDRPTTED